MENEIQTYAESFLASKNSEDFTKLYDRLVPGVKNYIRPFIKDFNDKYCDIENEILANTFVKVYTKIDQYNSEYKFSTWVYSIAKYTAWAETNRIKRLVYLSNYQNESGEEMDIVALENLVNKDEFTSIVDIEMREETEMQHMIYDKAIEAINELGIKHKEILIDRELHGMKYEDLAEKYRLPLNTLKSRIRCGRLKVKEKINKFIED